MRIHEPISTQRYFEWKKKNDKNTQRKREKNETKSTEKKVFVYLYSRT